MGTMHKEVIQKKKASTIILTTIVLCCVIVISQKFESVKFIGVKLDIIINPILLVLMLGFIILEFRRCSVQIKYSIVGDKLIINKICEKELHALQSININDIVDIKKKKLGTFNSLLGERYFCSFITLDLYCCTYRSNGKNKKFYFKPSDCLVKKIESKINR